MTVKKIFQLCFLLVCQVNLAQNDSILLDEVVVTDGQLHRSQLHSVLTLNDSVIAQNRPTLTELLNYNTPIYFKENGPGMVSSVAFRGTTAQHTAVIWNGLNVNSTFNGQTDFNTVSTRNFDNIAVRSGGGSIIYGSSAIGGSVHLNNDLTFGKRLENRLSFDYGSFDTFGANYRFMASSKTFSVQAGMSRNSSTNDFDWPGSGGKNENGQYYNTGFDIGLGLKINHQNVLKLYGYAYDGERHFSLISPTDTKSKYADRNARMLLEWANISGKLSSKIKAACLSEQYRFFANIDSDATNFGDAQTLVVKYDGLYAITPTMSINAIADYTQTEATGSDVGNNTRRVGSVAALYSHRFKKFGYEAAIRQEITDNYHSPLLFSAGASYRFNQFYSVKINGSKNFRIPSFNDLYWGEGGNTDLLPESSLQAELSNVVGYKNWEFTLTAYYISIENMIQWLPGTTTLWHPMNVNEVTSYGLESKLNWHAGFGAHRLGFSGVYAYTVSENDRTGYQLIYVPYHKATAALAYGWKNFSADFQFVFCGEVFTRSDNDPGYNIDAYAVSNLGCGYMIEKQHGARIGMRILNLFDENYQVVAARPFPGRHYDLYLNLKF